MVKRLILLLAACAFIAGAGGAYWRWGHRLHKTTEEFDYEQAKSLLAAGESRLAALLVEKYKGKLTKETPQGLDWLPIAVETMIQTNDATDLARLYESYPRLIDGDQNKALAVAGGLLGLGRITAYHELRQEWKAKRHNEVAWLVLDADALIIQGKKGEATALLESQVFEGPDDSMRLVRLAIYKASETLSESWDLLQKALAKDPKNSHVLSYRGQILEMVRQPALARHEYVLAIEASPKDLFLYDRLALFELRWGQTKSALETWKKALAVPNNAFIRLRIMFWSRVVVPFSIDWKQYPPPKGILQPLLDYLLALPPGTIWDDAAFEKIPNHQNLLKTYQETFWLRLADALIRKQEEKALGMLTSNLFSHQLWAPDLARGLHQILSYRRYGVLNTEDNTPAFVDTPGIFHHSFFRQLWELSKKSAKGFPAENLPREMDALLLSQYAFPAAFLAAGWFEAALDFGIPTVLPDSLPDWLAYAYTQAIRTVRGPIEALQFAMLQHPSDLVSLLIGELMLSTGSPEAALAQLQPLVQQDSDAGSRAAWLTASTYVQREKYAEAKSIIQGNAHLRNSVLGKELLAVIALAENNPAEAESLYAGIEMQSSAARLYLARRAMADQDYDRALELYESLLREFPEKRDLQEDLEKVKKAKTKR